MYRRLLLGMTFGVFLAGPAGATIISLTASSGGIDYARVCTSVTCGTAPWVSTSLYAVTGTITIDTTLNTLALSLFADTSVISGAAINGVTSLTFDDATYGGTVAVTAAAGPLGSTVYTISASQNASLAVPTLTEAGGSSGAYSRPAIRVTGSCLVHLDGTGQCGFTFGASGTPSTTAGQFYVGSVNGFYLNRWVRQTMNLGVVPEPGPLALMLAGLAGLAMAGRRRAS